MSKRSSLFVGVFLLSAVAGAETTDARNPVTTSRHCRVPGCAVGEVQPVLALQNETFLHLWFEGVATGKDGSIYTQEQCTGDVYRIRPNGQTKVMTTIPYGVENNYTCDYAGGLGMAVSEDGDVWLVVYSGLEQSHGVWRIHRNGTAEFAVPLSPVDAGLPNAIAFDRDGNLYITESWGGAIWKVRPGGAAELWLQHDLLAPVTAFGANGITYLNGALYVVNTDQGTIVKVPLRRDGAPGTPVVTATGFNGPDGVTADAFGNLYVVTAWGAQLVRIGPRGTPEIVLDMAAAGVAYPTSVDIGKIVKEMNTAYIANFIPKAGEPNLVKVNLCEKRWGLSGDRGLAAP